MVPTDTNFLVYQEEGCKRASGFWFFFSRLYFVCSEYVTLKFDQNIIKVWIIDPNKLFELKTCISENLLEKGKGYIICIESTLYKSTSTKQAGIVHV